MSFNCLLQIWLDLYNAVAGGDPVWKMVYREFLFLFIISTIRGNIKIWVDFLYPGNKWENSGFIGAPFGCRKTLFKALFWIWDSCNRYQPGYQKNVLTSTTGWHHSKWFPVYKIKSYMAKYNISDENWLISGYFITYW